MAGPAPTPLRNVARGLVAGVVGTGFMTGTQMLQAKLQTPAPEQGGDEPQDPWEQASAPAKVGRLIIEGVFEREVPVAQIPLLTNVMHWAYGTGWGAVYGLVQGGRRTSPVRDGLVFGTAVWAMAYVQLVPLGIYELPWKYSANELASELSFHLAYGPGVSSAYRVMAAR
jgi:uncharacterized membrane protein YagU involved in acid resistance